MDLKLPPEIDAALAREARRAHKPKAALLRRAVEAYLEGLAETAHLLRSPRNAARLRDAHEEIEKEIADAIRRCSPASRP